MSSELLVTMSKSPSVLAEKAANSQRSRSEANGREVIDTSKHNSSQVLLGPQDAPALLIFLQTNQFPFMQKLIQDRFLSFAIKSTNTPRLHKHYSSSFPAMSTTPPQSPSATPPSLRRSSGLCPRLSTLLHLHTLPEGACPLPGLSLPSGHY